MAGFGQQNKKPKKPPLPRNQEGAEELHKQALDHHRQGDLINAEKAYREAIRTGYLHHSVFSNLGVICQDSGRKEERKVSIKVTRCIL